MEIGIQVLQALLAGAVASWMFWLLWGWMNWRAWAAVALPYALLVYLILFGKILVG